MLSPELKNTIDNIENPIYLISSEGQIVYLNPSAKEYTANVESGNFFLEKLCGRRIPCKGCPMNRDCTAACKVSDDALCAFASVAFKRIVFENEEYLISEWIINSKNRSYIDAISTAEKNNSELSSLSEVALESFKELNVAAALENAGGEKEVYISILRTYLIEGLKKISVIKQYYENRDYTNLRIEVHGVKGTSYVVGAEHLGNYAKKLEYACKAVEADEDNSKVESAKLLIANNIYDFLEEFNLLLSKLSNAFDVGTSSDSDSVSVSNGISDNEFIDILKSENIVFDDYNNELFLSVLSSLDEYDIDNATDKLKEINKSSFNIENDEIYVMELSLRCLELLNSYDYSGAAEMIKPFIR